jgi:DNA-binding transcriptional LysR family regulator
MRRLILHGSGSGFLPTTLVSDDLASGRLIALPVSDAPSLTRELALVRHADGSALPTAVTDFVDLIRRETARMGMV